MKTLLLLSALSIFTVEVVVPERFCDNPDGGKKKKKDEEGEETCTFTS
jgi:hypothetical protein